MLRAFRRITAWWFRPRTFEMGVYRWFGVAEFKRLFMAAVGKRRLRLNYGLEGRDATSLRAFERWTRVFEGYHLLLGAAFAGVVIDRYVTQRHVSVELVALGCVLNLYLVILQRFNRVRLLKRLTRIESRETPNKAPQPTPVSVTDRAAADSAPAIGVADL